MKQIKETGFIFIDDENGIPHNVCTLDYYLNEDDSFKYVFTPNYCVINLLSSRVFIGIPGLNLNLKKKEYIRENIIPCFISERVPQKNREDLYELLEEVGLDYLDPIEYLIRTKKQYFGDKFYVVKPFDKKTINIEEKITTQNLSGIIKLILKNLALGHDIKVNDTLIDDNNREDIFKLLSFLSDKSLKDNKMKQEQGINNAKKLKKYKGRKKIDVNIDLFNELKKEIDNNLITVKIACSKLKISRSTYYRILNTL